MVPKKGFTIIELLVVVGIVGVLSAVIFLALDPVTRFEEARDVVRQNDVSMLLSAIASYQRDHEGQLPPPISTLGIDQVYMVVNGATMTAGCADNNDYCTTDVSTDSSCVDISMLLSDKYLARMPVSPGSNVLWDEGSASGQEGSGYTVAIDSAGVVTIRACEHEHVDTEIMAVQ